MTLGHLSTSASAAGTGDLTWTHTPSATVRGVLVVIVQNSGTTDEVTGVTYGGVALAEVNGSPLVVSAGTEDGVVYAYFLGAGIPAGAQTVTVTVSGSSTKRANLYNVSAASDTSVEDAVAADLGVAADPTGTLTTSVATYICGALFSGQNNPASISAPADTSQTLVHDFGNQSCAWHRRSTVPVTAGSPTLGWTATAEEAGVFAVAIREGTAGATVALAAAVLALSAQPVTPVPGPVTVALAPAILTFAAQSLTPVSGPLSVLLAPAILPMVAVPLTPVPEPVTVALVPAVLAFSAVAVSPTSTSGGVILAPAVLTLTAVPLTPVPGPVTVALEPAVLVLAARPLSPQSGPIFVQLAPALLALVAVALNPSSVPQPTGRPGRLATTLSVGRPALSASTPRLVASSSTSGLSTEVSTHG